MKSAAGDAPALQMGNHALESDLHGLMGICMLWEPIYMVEKSSAQFSERIDAVWEGIYTLGEAANTL